MKSISSNENLISKDKYFLLYSKPHNIYYKSSNLNVHKIGPNILFSTPPDKINENTKYKESQSCLFNILRSSFISSTKFSHNGFTTSYTTLFTLYVLFI